ASCNRELAAVRNDARHRHRDAEGFPGFAFARGQPRTALGSVVRQEVSGCDPKPGGRNEADGGEAARVHRELFFAACVTLRRGLMDAPLKPVRRQQYRLAWKRQCHWNWALARRMTRKSPDPIFAPQQSLRSLAKLRLRSCLLAQGCYAG